MPLFVEPIHIELKYPKSQTTCHKHWMFGWDDAYLPDKGCIFLMAEVLRQNLILKPGQIMDDKPTAILAPTHDIGHFPPLHYGCCYLEHGAGVADKCRWILLSFYTHLKTII